MLGFAALAEVALAEVLRLATAPPPPLPPQPTGPHLFNYIFRFSDFGAAARDPIVGPLLLNFSEVLIFNPVAVDSVNALPGYWVMVSMTGLNSVLEAHPNIQIVNDQTLMAQGKPSVIAAKIDVSNINIMINILGAYVLHGLKFV